MWFKAVLPLLVKIGFKKRAGYVFTLETAPGVLGWLGLNHATRYMAKGEAEVNPIIGVRFQDVERLVAECRGEKFHPYQPPTIGSSLGYLMPENRYKGWAFTPGKYDHVASEMTNAIVSYGVPFMRSVLDIAELRRRLEDGMGSDHGFPYRRLAAALVAGDVEQARVLLDEAVEALGARTDPAASEARNFAECFRSRLPPS